MLSSASQENGLHRTISWRDPRNDRRQMGARILSESRDVITKAFAATKKPGPKRLPLLQKCRHHHQKSSVRASSSRKGNSNVISRSAKRSAARRRSRNRSRGKRQNRRSQKTKDPSDRYEKDNKGKSKKTALFLTLPKIHKKLMSSSSLLSQTLIHKHLLSVTKKRLASMDPSSPAEGESMSETSPLLSPENPYRRPKGNGVTTEYGFKSYRKRLQVTPLKKIANNMHICVGSGRTPVVLVSVGAFNPAHLNHLRIFHLAKQHLELTQNYAVVGGFVCPSHDKFVTTKCRGRAHEAIPARHRVRMLEILFAGSSWIDVDRWEVTRRCGFLDYPAVLQHVQTLVTRTFGSHVKVICLCGPTHLLRLTPDILEEHNAICVTRRGYIQGLVEKMASEWPGAINICVDDDIIPISLANATSAKVRKRLGRGDLSVDDMTGPEVHAYIMDNRIADKISNRAPWTRSDRETRALVRPQTFLAELESAVAVS